MKSTVAGQVNAFFRWNNLQDAADRFEMSLFLANSAELQTKFEIPKEANADVTLRRLQSFQIKPGEAFQWKFGLVNGKGKADEQGLITIPALKITTEPTTLTVSR